MDRRVVAYAARAAGIVASTIGGNAIAENSFASGMVSYLPGSGIDPAYTDPLTALGEPARMSGFSVGFPGVVSPFAAPWEPTDLVSIGRGGSLVVRFDHPVVDDPGNPYGIDLLVFGNSFYENQGGIAGSLYSGGGTIEVSADGLDWRAISGVQADGRFPTLGFSDLTDPYSEVPGSVLSNFTIPVDPSFDPLGRTFAQIMAGYGRSGGGAGVDLGTVGLSSVTYVRISNPADATLITQIDALSDVTAVPAPWTLALLIPALGRRRR